MKLYSILCLVFFPLTVICQIKYKTYHNDTKGSVKISSEIHYLPIRDYQVKDSSEIVSRFKDALRTQKESSTFSDTVLTFSIDSTIYQLYRITDCCCTNLSAPTGHVHSCNTLYYSTQFGAILCYSEIGGLNVLIEFNGNPFDEKLIRIVLKDSWIIDQIRNKNVKKDLKKQCLTKPKRKEKQFKFC